MAANKFAVALAAMASAGLIATFPAAMARAGNVDRFGVKEISGPSWQLSAVLEFHRSP